jgi:hypothetical protein
MGRLILRRARLSNEALLARRRRAKMRDTQLMGDYGFGSGESRRVSPG